MAEKRFWQKPVLLGLFVIFLLINVLDFVSSIIGVVYNHLIETNWLADDLSPNLGVIGAFVVVKTIFLALITLSILIALHSKKLRIDDDIAIGGLVLLNIIGLLVLSSNFQNLGWGI